jgi:predicted hydrocarbon binding protein
LKHPLAEGKHRRPSARAVAAEALGREVEVDLVRAIGKGDQCCEFVVSP